MSKDNNFPRLLILLILTAIFCFAMYFLPENILGIDIKKVDLLADIRSHKEDESLLDSLRLGLESPVTTLMDSEELRDSLLKVEGMDSIVLAERDSLYRLLNDRNGDSTLVAFEDYTIGHVGLKRFYAALENCSRDKQPVRIGFMGDSFIEGDIIVGDFRSEMQKQFGGSGVGFIPVSSVAAPFRTTIKQKSSGWEVFSMITDHKNPYWLSGMVFKPEDERATLSFELPNSYPHLSPVNSVKFIYRSSSDSELKLFTNKDSIAYRLEASPRLAQFEHAKSEITKADFQFDKAKGLEAMGVAFESADGGVIVDNFSLRGNSGLIIGRMDSALCHEFNEIRPYKLLILQYGLNVASDSTMHYGWYADRMETAINHLKRCFPETDIILLGVSDRSRQKDGKFETMPAVLSLLHSQRKLAQKLHVVFWNTFAAMGGENSMVRFVDNNWASKDYTHISFRGGKEISKSLIKAILHEKDFYEKADKNNR